MIVLGYHGCDTKAAQDLLGGSDFLPSEQPYDWLGTGAYFWEDDIQRAYDWALERRSNAPCVVGAVIDLGNCLDLTKQSGIRALKTAYDSYCVLMQQYGKQMPSNDAARGTKFSDRVLRHLDRAVIDHLHSLYQTASRKDDGKTKEFDTVRGMVPEGETAYEGAGFWERTHVQIAVRRPEQVLGVFRIPVHQLQTLKLTGLYSGL